ncbi:hypothetical protein INT47_012676 [Mucor saturninus]|uniref:DDE Tnp4 domain-containing protein n=1 Tax=Mucor saturninus TaxID=64648 RepID=A0A8H7QFA8_9FUNG|nr:hypothetical protein INT47_012676 [Mucor saturninus]
MRNEGFDEDVIFMARTALMNDPVLLKLQSLESHRYLSPRISVPRRFDRWERFVDSLDETRWKQDMRMSKESFGKILTMVSGHRLYQSSESGRQQTSVRKQLMVVLLRLGSDGNGASVGRIARLAGISEGSVHAFTTRFFDVMLSMEGDVIKWPGKEQKERIKDITKNNNGFPDCLGFVDGTLIHLEYKPKFRGLEFFNRKKRYSIQTMAVCDPDRRITFFATGFLGCRNDSRVFGSSDLGRNLDKYFEDDEYILGDSGYSLEKNVIIPYRDNEKGGFTKEMKKCNYLHARTRVSIENCFGGLKMRFGSLRNLRCKINVKEDLYHVMRWIRVCAMLHNILLDDVDDVAYHDNNYNGHTPQPRSDVMDQEPNVSSIKSAKEQRVARDMASKKRDNFSKIVREFEENKK